MKRFILILAALIGFSTTAQACDCYTVYNTVHRIMNSADVYKVWPDDMVLALYERDLITAVEIDEARIQIATLVGTPNPDVAILPHSAEQLAELVSLCKKM